MTDFTFPYLHLRFDLVARTAIKLGGYQAGERLRDALAQVMLRAVCPENPRRQTPTPEHAAVCPACWLLAADTDPGLVRRAYALVPPLPPADLVPAGGRFSFALTLFGQGLRFLPYFVLAVPEVGRNGIGPGRGKFELEGIWGMQPLTGSFFPLLLPGERVVRPPNDLPAPDFFSLAAGLPPQTDLRLRFLTPTRLIADDRLVKVPDFAVFFHRLLQRIDALNRQYQGGGPRTPEEVQRLHALADAVRLVDVNTEWIDLWGPSGRTGRNTPMSGFVGTATFRARDWSPLLPWLLLGQGVQVGKLAAKGNGVYELALPDRPGYWQTLFFPVEARAGQEVRMPWPSSST